MTGDQGSAWEDQFSDDSRAPAEDDPKNGKKARALRGRPAQQDSRDGGQCEQAPAADGDDVGEDHACEWKRGGSPCANQRSRPARTSHASARSDPFT